jgi:Cd2+/Zn2+-exporting ATPase/Cu+-exporting ATPase
MNIVRTPDKGTADDRRDDPHMPEHEHGVEWPELIRIGFVALAAILLWFQPAWMRDHIRIFGWAAIAIGGYPIYMEARENLRARRMTMELSMTLALVCAAGIGEFFTALVITLFVLVAEILEGLTVKRGRLAIADLLDVLPKSVFLRRGEAIIPVDLRDLEIGGVVLVKPGGRLPVDGTVVGGHSFVDESTITGEPMPVEKQAGNWVHAGSINQSGALDIRVERIGRDTAFGRIVEAVEEAERSKAPIQKVADRLAAYLVYFALICAAFTWIITRDLRSTISVIIVAGACGIAAGTPLAILGAIGRSARLGAIVKGGIFLEALSQVDTVVLDKTGTLTFGTPQVVQINPEPGHWVDEVLALAAMAEQRSEHPLGGAILRRAKEEGVLWEEPAHFTSLPGHGVSARGSRGQVLVGNQVTLAKEGIEVGAFDSPDHPASTEVLVALDNVLIGRIWIADAARAEAKAAVLALQAMGIQTVLLTGDAIEAAVALGRELRIESMEAGLLPDQKRTRIMDLKRQGRRVAMVGDGVNDAPALMEAEVGIAMGSGTDVARETADVVLIGNDLMKLVETLKVARHMRRVILQNFVGTLAVDGIGVGMAAFGMLNPLLAAFIHVASELAFILNSTRLLPRNSSLATSHCR